MLRQVTWKTYERPRELEKLNNFRVARVEAGFPDLLRIGLTPVPPLHGSRQCCDPSLLETQSFTEIPYRTFGPVTDDGCRQRGTLAGVFAIYVLNDLLSPVVLEIHIYIRRLVALLGNEPLDEHF